MILHEELGATNRRMHIDGVPIASCLHSRFEYLSWCDFNGVFGDNLISASQTYDPNQRDYSNFHP